MSAEVQPGQSPVYRRRLIGRVRSDKMDKTVVVEVVRFKRDNVYKKYVRVRKRYHAHDEKNEYRVGDRVEIIEHRPLSKHKRWAVTRLLERPAAELFQRTAHPADQAAEGQGDQ